MHGFVQEHPVICLVLIASILMFSGRLEYDIGFKPVAYWSWFLGGILAVATLAGGICGYFLFLGLFRGLLAAIVFVLGMSLLWRLRPKGPNG